MSKGQFLRLLASLVGLWSAMIWPVAAADTSVAVAPFGLSWDASSADVEALGVKLEPFSLPDFGKSFTATNVPKVLVDTQTIILSFGYDDKLWRIVAIGRSSDNDPYGNSVQSRFSELSTSLKDKYSNSQQFHQLSSDDYYQNPKNFVWGIDQGENHWFDTFSAPGVDIELSILATSSDSSYWRLIYNSKLGEQRFQHVKSNKETDAL